MHKGSRKWPSRAQVSLSHGAGTLRGSERRSGWEAWSTWYLNIERAMGTWCREGHSGHTTGAKTPACSFMRLLRKPDIVPAVKGEMLTRIAFTVLEQPLKGKFEAERQ